MDLANWILFTGRQFRNLNIDGIVLLASIRDGGAYAKLAVLWGRVIWLYMYCLFCETQKCTIVALTIERKYGIQAISPEIIQRKWVKGVCEEKRHNWLPGYVFLYSETPLTHRFVIPGIIRWLGKGELQYEDEAFARMIYEKGGVLGTLKLADIGDRCVIDDPLWAKMEGIVTKIDRGRKRCRVEFIFDNLRRSVWLGYEMIRFAEE